MLHFYSSNLLESLLSALSNVIKANPLPPLQSEIIVVQSKGMERWLALELSKKLGIWANATYPFPREMIQQLFYKGLSFLPDVSDFDPNILGWTIMRLLPEILEDQAFNELNNYLSNEETSDLKHYQLAHKIADVFDQYVIYRSDWIECWENSEQPPHWQAKLWQLIQEDINKRYPQHLHRSALQKHFIQAIEKQTLRSSPSRLIVFGISALSPFYMDIFQALSQRCDIHFFILNPCQEYWYRILSEKEISKINIKSLEKAKTEHHEVGNSLLASLGKIGGEFLDIFYNLKVPSEDHEFFEEPCRNTLLSYLQNDIFNLKETKKEKTILNDDHSIQIHSCHSKMREIEVLHDQLLDLFEKNPKLMPNDVLVMAPNIDSYAPLIQAVFDRVSEYSKQPRLPFSIADRRRQEESHLIEAFIKGLNLADSRITVSQVMSVLESPTVRNKFKISQQDIILIERWLKQARIRWGIDENSRTALELPAFAENSWAFGKARLLLGYALPTREQRLFKNILPVDDLEGNEIEVFGRFLDYIDQLFGFCKELNKSHTPIQWYELLQKFFKTFFEDSENLRDNQLIQNAIFSLKKSTDKAAFNQEISLNITRSWIKEHLAKNIQTAGFMTGNITFCALMPMRSIPFKVVVLLGMNAQDYPRAHHTPSFDLIHKKDDRFRVGDRSRRDDDRYLFLEAILSAREFLYFSYIGQSIQDNSEIPPSILLNQLVDYLEQNFILENHQSVQEMLITKHPLQPFSKRYFTGEKGLFSYSQDYFEAVQQLSKKELSIFFEKPLPEAEESWRKINLDQLIQFYKNPCAYILRNRLDICFEDQTILAENTEPFEVEGLEKYYLQQNLLERHLYNIENKEFFEITKASGILPPESIGKQIYESLNSEVREFSVQLLEKIDNKPQKLLAKDLKLNNFELYGEMRDIYPSGFIQYRYAELKAKDFLSAWIKHLFLNTYQLSNTWIIGLKKGKYKCYKYQPLLSHDIAQQYIQELSNYYWEGLSFPLAFLPEISYKYVNELRKKSPNNDALVNAQLAWEHDDNNTFAENNDPYYLQCFKNKEIFDESFVKISKAIYEPLFDHRQDN
jgi:exodeoxyribonuclease V gamma subunit